MQFPRAHLIIADAMLRGIPDRYRSFRRWGGIKEQAPVLPLEQMNAADPSEAIRAREFIPLIAARFAILYARPIGGTLLLLVLNEIVGNFDPDNPGDSLYIEWLIAAERSLIDSGMLPSYHAYLICGKSGTPTPIQPSLRHSRSRDGCESVRPRTRGAIPAITPDRSRRFAL